MMANLRSRSFVIRLLQMYGLVDDNRPPASSCVILDSVVHTYVRCAALGDHHTLAEVLKLLLLALFVHVRAFRE
jgi:hypothetical protein